MPRWRGNPEVLDLLVGFDLNRLERSTESVIATDQDFLIQYLNPAYFQFAQENGGDEIRGKWTLGSSYFAAISPPLHGFYRRVFEEVIESGSPWYHEYECSSASLHREFHMDVFPLKGVGGVLVVNSILSETFHDGHRRPPCRPEEKNYRDLDGMITQCSHCRRVRRSDCTGQWDWVPAWVESPPRQVTGGLCLPCFRLHYPAAALPI